MTSKREKHRKPKRKDVASGGNLRAVPLTRATPDNPHPEGSSGARVNPSYDQMPDTIEDPAAVFKLAYLDMKQTAANNQLAYVAQEYEKKMQMLQLERTNALNNLKANIQRIEKDRRLQKEHIETTYNIALRSYTYDDITGVLTKQAFSHPDENNTGLVPQEESPEEEMVH